MASRTHEVYFVHAAIWWTNIDATQGNEGSKPPIVAVLEKNIDPTKYCQAHFGEVDEVTHGKYKLDYSPNNAQHKR